MYVDCSSFKIRDVIKLPLGDGRRFISIFVYFQQMSLQSTQNSRSFHFPPKSGAARTRETLTYKKCFQIGLSRNQSLLLTSTIFLKQVILPSCIQRVLRDPAESVSRLM